VGGSVLGAIQQDDEGMSAHSFFYAYSVKDGKKRLEQMFEPEILGEVADMANPNLLNKNANHNRLNQKLIKAVKQGELSQVKALLAQGADANAKDSCENAPILYFALLGRENIKMVELLLQNKADPNTWFENLRCPILFLAITTCSNELIETLDTLGLNQSRYFSPQDCVRILLQYGADPYVEDANGLNAFEFAKELKLPDLVDIMGVEIAKLEAEELRVVAQVLPEEFSQPRSRL
ncbi:MAG: ankyrin repeat domain-containing protein, partial [Candidatus Obscuribacterales bacterium]|nr:ankyrin repeat domain-containing protein [Candidatus Obscuribacterales bacterium]